MSNLKDRLMGLLMKPSTYLSILTGILVGTSYIPFPPWAIFFAFVPLWICWLKANSWRQVFWTGWIAQFVLALIGFNWVAYTVHEFGHLPWVAAVLTLFLFCSLANLHIPLVGLTWFFIVKRFRLNVAAQVCMLAILASVGERIFPMIFDWHFGYTWLWAGFPAFQLADIVGFVGLSNIGFFFNAALLWAWWLSTQKRAWWPLAVFVPALFLLMNVWGHFHKLGLQTPDAKLRFLIVQANIGNQEKLMAEQGWAFRDTVINRFAATTREGLKREGPADFVVWPETAFPEIIGSPSLNFGYALKLKSFIQSTGTKLITGGYWQLPGTGKLTNSFFALSEGGEWLAPPYSKTILLAFGEYLPGAEWFPSLRARLPEVGDFGRGPGPTVMNAGPVRIGAQVCYEGLFDWFARALANKGAQLIVNLTNDSWYGTWEQPYQHGYMTLAHAIEVRRPLVRSTNTGLSTVILANGDILALSPLHEEWFHLYEVPYVTQPETTLFMGWAYWLIPGLLALGFLLCLICGRQRSHDQSRLG